jgi:hypothetical protein
MAPNAFVEANNNNSSLLMDKENNSNKQSLQRQQQQQQFVTLNIKSAYSLLCLQLFSVSTTPQITFSLVDNYINMYILKP